ncbi:RDD family protein [Wolbachia endosymbiont of Diaphorina citri]|jgi:RDD family.|uniref:RDD family protein n=1 Tax=Wolbachia endosymbiont of Diaphorina citri TaxID=116598 RepID=UPI00031AC231|nr:RDD family protein [Wolbachia endosymbiont of Diaphorina citri]QJT94639.1 RDD family protein [Wolbachia endosymbiont of Diaphorina citri]QJT95878.1 RDD family protein [Wolbachia endosymbiont of Diaphorina citri]QJT97240.1 RDD family protein [Wolbachia endosymbiont of Diaphorina citri]QLK11536.1 RDD family protein [Wolbachia endosymbiont of Diaphorina citri]QXY86931.1 RDD family protein [Wolbachia endosymbiont of Diaphorina citri]
MDTETNIKVNYVGFTRRAAAEVLDLIIFSPDFIFAFIYGVFIASLEDKDFFQELEQLATKIPFVIFTVVATLTLTISKILMVTKLGGTPGKLLCGMHIKDANTLTNATLMQATIRCLSKGSIWIIFRFLLHLHYHGYTFLYLLIVLILFLFAVFDQRKQAFYDRFAKTIVIDYKPS